MPFHDGQRSVDSEGHSSLAPTAAENNCLMHASIPQCRCHNLSQPLTVLLIFQSLPWSLKPHLFSCCCSNACVLQIQDICICSALCLKHPAPISWSAPSFCLFNQDLPGSLTSRITHSMLESPVVYHFLSL